MQTTFTIRRTVQTDAAPIVAILQQTQWVPHFTNENLQEHSKRISDLLAGPYSTSTRHSAYVAEDENITGYVAVHGLPYIFLATPEGYISEIFVDEQFRKKGIGKALFKTV
ncbi:GNAT family N-acetyltransferase [Chlorobium sp. KB01]|uniref:GNAT family N-acetyltransferase n=1 Tax=Chlorobium sp. KB01 TaxID=1917528 RepID=UPI000977120A|nr:GNAT family N-acetyltransferase [Chlorobium sp. KB01]